MKAYVLHAIGDLRLDEAPEPELKAGWCLVRVAYAGICSSDIPRVFRNGTYHFPTIPGHEFSGVVEKIGDGVDVGLLGKRVGVFPLIPCRACPSCKRGEYETCEHYDYLGSRRDGGFAELVAVPAWNLLPLPDSVTLEAAAMLEPLSVALHAAKRANISRGASVAVTGTGLIGFAVACWAALLGAGKVCVIGRGRGKASIANQLRDVDYLSLDEVAGREFDIVIEAVGSPESISSSIGAVRAGGTLLLMGNPTGDIDLEQNVYWRILRKQLEVRGTWNSSYENGDECDWTQTLGALATGQMDVSPFVSHRYRWEDLRSGIEMMYKKSEPYCKVMTVWSGAV